MLPIESEQEWLVALPERSKLLFLAALSHELTIAGRSSYEVQTEGLTNPARLRRINEIQHRISATMQELLGGTLRASFERSIATLVLGQPDAQFLLLTGYAWDAAKHRVAHEG